jgi:hypothetical protein
MAENRRSPTAYVIDVFIPVDVPDPRTFPTCNEKWLAANIPKSAHRGIHAAGDAFLCALEQV